MKKNPKQPAIPPERQETVRQNILSVLQDRSLSAKEVSAQVRVSEKEVYAHLEHIQRTISNRGLTLAIVPPECRKCGFIFRKREKFKKPGRCPVCRCETIQEPLFSISSGA